MKIGSSAELRRNLNSTYEATRKARDLLRERKREAIYEKKLQDDLAISLVIKHAHEYLTCLSRYITDEEADPQLEKILDVYRQASGLLQNRISTRGHIESAHIANLCRAHTKLKKILTAGLDSRVGSCAELSRKMGLAAVCVWNNSIRM